MNFTDEQRAGMRAAGITEAEGRMIVDLTKHAMDTASEAIARVTAIAPDRLALSVLYNTLKALGLLADRVAEESKAHGIPVTDPFQ